MEDNNIYSPPKTDITPERPKTSTDLEPDDPTASKVGFLIGGLGIPAGTGVVLWMMSQSGQGGLSYGTALSGHSRFFVHHC